VSYVCWDCRYCPRSPVYDFSRVDHCPHCGKEMVYVHVHLPASRDDHKMWKLAREKAEKPSGRPRRRRRRLHLTAQRRSVMPRWEKDLLKAATKK
jgi:rRNA maturation protein Nop10